MSIFTITKDKIHEDMTAQGFILKRTSYYRPMEGYVQAFKIYTNLPSFSIRFYQSPLCSGLDHRVEGDDVCVFWDYFHHGPFSFLSSFKSSGSPFKKLNPFGIDMANNPFITGEYDMNAASEVLVRSLYEYVLPYFNKSNTLENAYKVEREFHLKNDPSSPPMHISEEFHWHLQMRKYDIAAELLEKLNKWFYRMYGCANPERDALLESFHNNDIAAVEAYIEKIEYQSLQNLGIVKAYNKLYKK